MYPADEKVSVSAGLHRGLVCFILSLCSGIMRPHHLFAFALSAFSLSSLSFFFCHGNLKFMPMPHASLPSFRCTSPANQVQIQCQQVTHCTDYHCASATCVRHACHLPYEVNGKKTQARHGSHDTNSVCNAMPSPCMLKSFQKARAYEALRAHQISIKGTRQNDAYICADKTVQHENLNTQQQPLSKFPRMSIGGMNQARKCPPRSTTPELCFMLAPPAPPAPVASSKPPSPFGPAHNQAGRCKLVITIPTALQA